MGQAVCLTDARDSKAAGGPLGRRRWAVLGWVFLATVLLGACGYPLPQEEERGKGPGGREQPLVLSPQEELEVGHQAFEEIKTEFHDRFLPADSPEVARVRRVTARLKKAAEIEPLQREINLRVRGYSFEWEANVIQERQVNAFCLPGGKMFVFTGILKVVGNDDQLAAVLGHEAAHALAHHGNERLARERSGGGVLRNLSFSRRQEEEADHIGVFLTAFADYDPGESVVFWERMHRARGDKGE
ncbi:MAG TPA: M48 family metallopeptidase, partial [Gemmataceae bacterium]|nr:M48 family metallopeptidase [Gemmataceae bacterium]